MTSKVVVVLVMLYLSGFTCGIRLDGNGYTDILIAINPAVTEDPLLIERIKEMMSDASSYLFQVMKNKLYFKDVTILVPPNWTGKYSRANTETYEKANIKIDEPNKLNGNDPYTLQYGECGTPGRYIHLTPDFLKRDDLIQVYGPRGRVLVHEWAHLRWGVYDEYDDKNPFYTDDGILEATRCTRDMTGEWRSRSGFTCTPTNTNGEQSDCHFFLHEFQTAKASVMYLQSIDSVVQFCNEENHNTKAPNDQNRMCGGRSVQEVIFYFSVDSQNIPSTSLPSPSPEPTFSVVQRKQRVVCLVLDVSGSMKGQRIVRQRQAASLFLKQIIEDQSYAGIVTFHSTASVLKPLTLIDNLETREKLADLLPTNPDGGTEICLGLFKGLEVLKTLDGFSNGKEIIFLTDGESNSPIDCVKDAVTSGAIVHTISLGPKGDPLMEEMSKKTGGKFFYAGDTLTSNELVDVFASLTTSDGDLTQQTIQLESLGSTVSGSGLFSGTVSIDKTIGNNTAFVILYELSPPLIVLIESPSGNKYNTFTPDPKGKSLTLNIPGTAETGKWTYTITNNGQAQTISITVTSRAVSADVPPVIVKTHMNQQSSNGAQAMVVFAEVSQNGLPVIMADIRATLESDAGDKQELDLLDNGAGADVFKNDGIYSRYFTQMKGGKYNLKVKVQNGYGKARFSRKRRSAAMYIPGYVVDGKLELNPPKPSVGEEDLVADVGNFSRTAIGETFTVTLPPGVLTATKFPPNTITDLNAELVKDRVLLTWTAPGEELDQGTASEYEIRYNEDPDLLRSNFSTAHLINSSNLLPNESGSSEQLFFTPTNGTMRNITTLFFAVKAVDKEMLSSETSNLAQVTIGNGVNIVTSPSPVVCSVCVFVWALCVFSLQVAPITLIASHH
ncbi:calcium-activated chloride channel regulator 3A-1-like [Osmerus mordax]|uniref:calcium-activated chloride channel regulator 3A-1-like n=1 Tax=Osmerus mordax TaxID=8014 RepID=UPI00350EFED0